MSWEDPNVGASLVESKGVNTRQWVIQCPYCGKRHYHGAGYLSDDPREFLGHRLAHCMNGKGYFLVEAEQ